MSFLNELDVSFEYDFVLFGICTQARDHKLAWNINQALRIHLTKASDLVIDFQKDSRIVLANFIFKTTHCTFRLLKNESYTTAGQQPVYLLPDQQQFDHLLMIQDDTETFRTQETACKLNAVPDINTLVLLDVPALTFKENLIF